MPISDTPWECSCGERRRSPAVCDGESSMPVPKYPRKTPPTTSGMTGSSAPATIISSPVSAIAMPSGISGHSPRRSS